VTNFCNPLNKLISSAVISLITLIISLQNSRRQIYFRCIGLYGSLALNDHIIIQFSDTYFSSAIHLSNTKCKDRHLQPKHNYTGYTQRMVWFQKLTTNLFLTWHGHNVHRQQRQLTKFLMRYQQFVSHAYCGAARPVFKMASQQEKAFCVLRFEVSRSVITVQLEVRARFRKDAPCLFSKDTWLGARGGAVGWGTALQAGRSRVRFPMVSLEFSLTKSFRPDYGSGVDSASNRNEYQEYFLKVKAAGT